MKKIIADNLKKYRGLRGWSLSKAAEKTQVSKAMLGQLERQESSPTMATLWKIAKGFELPLSVLIEPCSEHAMVLAPVSANLDNIFKLKLLFSFDPILCSEMFLLTLPLGKESFSVAHAQGVIEDIVVIGGELDVFVNEKWQLLAAGDSLRFNADQEHGYRNCGAADAVFHNIIHYPKR